MGKIWRWVAIVSAMPFLLGGVMTAMKPGMMIPFLTSAAGVASVLGMSVLIALGWLMIRKIIKIEV